MSKKRGWTLQDWTLTDDFTGVDIAGLDIDGLDNDGRIWAIDCNQLKITIECFINWLVRITVLKASYVLRQMKFTLISKNYEHAMSITWRVVYWHYKKLSYRRGTARCIVSIEILPIAMQQCRNYLYDKSWPNRWYEVGDLVGGNAW